MLRIKIDLLKILHLNGARPYGGNEQQLIDVASAMVQLDVTNHVYCRADSELCRMIRNDDRFVVHPAPAQFKSKASQRLLRSTIASIQPDVIHLHTSNAVTLFYFSFLWRSLSIPVVMAKKGMGSSMSFLSRIKYNSSKISAIACVSEYVKREMKEQVLYKSNYKKLTVIPDGIAVERCQKNSGHKETIISKAKKTNFINIANHTQAKDLGTLIEAIAYTINTLNYKDFKVYQFGSHTGLTDRLKTMAVSRGISEFIDFRGFVAEASMYLHDADAFIITSQREGGPSSVLEAMCVGKPIISTRVGVIPDAVRHGYNGFVLPVRDFKAIGKAIKQLAESRPDQMLLGERSKQIFNQQFTAAIAADSTYDLYKRLINHKY